jgi:hypothetical protein
MFHCMAVKTWTVYKIGSSSVPEPLTEIEAQFERTVLEHASARTGVPKDKLYAIPKSMAKRPRAKFVTLAWSEDGRYYEASYADTDLPALLEALRAKRARGVSIPAVYIDEREVSI